MPGCRTASPFRQELRQDVGTGVEFLNTVIAHVDDVDRSILLVDRHSAGEIELPVSVTEAAPGHDELARHIELLHPEIGAVDHIDIPSYTVDGNAPRRIELALAVPA